MLIPPPVGFHFVVTFLEFGANVIDIGFQSVSGLDVSMKTEPYREGGENRFAHTLPTHTSYSPLVLKRGLLVHSPIIKWCQDAFEKFEFQPTNIIVTLLNDSHVPLMVWNVVGAIPTKWSISEFNAEESRLVIETLELKYQYFNVMKLSPF